MTGVSCAVSPLRIIDPFIFDQTVNSEFDFSKILNTFGVALHKKRKATNDNLVALHFRYNFWHMTATAGSDVVQSGRPIFDDFFQHLWPYIGKNTANVVFQMVKHLWLIRIDQ
ncbi:adhesion G protein-coupled receptor B2 [Trichonephila clavipes]|nr:adhesion G protein-coupled receptor B2 [Trichonephila clavipes]